MSSPAGPPFTLRPAVHTDQAAIRRMVHQARLNPSGLDWQRFTVAVSAAAKVIGCVQVKPHAGGIRELASLVVRKTWQGQGVARALIEHRLHQEKGPLYLMCRSSLIPFYTRFQFRALEPAEMPSYFRRIHRLVGLANRLAHRADHLAIMCRFAQE